MLHQIVSNGRSKSTPVARSGGDRSPRSLQVHSGGPLRRRSLATVDKSRVREVELAPRAIRGLCSRLAWFRTLSLHPRRPVESTLVPEPGNRCTGLRGPGLPLSTRAHRRNQVA